jgi:hypothetical protein
VQNIRTIVANPNANAMAARPADSDVAAKHPVKTTSSVPMNSAAMPLGVTSSAENMSTYTAMPARNSVVVITARLTPTKANLPPLSNATISKKKQSRLFVCRLI